MKKVEGEDKTIRCWRTNTSVKVCNKHNVWNVWTPEDIALWSW